MGQVVRRPGRWIRNCEVIEADPCDSLTQADWNQKEWILSGGALARVFLLPNLVDGLIASIDTYPNGWLFNSNGVAVSEMVYNSSLGYYEPVQEGS
jgi:hypothetical protein